jgi:shikimate kinase
MHISLIGMSNIGKTYCAKRLAAHHGYRHIDCDALIEKRLGAELIDGGYHGTKGMARWMGFPADASYKTNSRRYTESERQAVSESLARLKKDKKASVVLDTTGSVIYTGAEILESLRATTRIIYFETSEEHISALFNSYINHHPKPVIWDDAYAPLAEETPQQTLERCYPELLRDRARRYKEIAHVTIPFEELKNHWADIGTFVLERASY